MNMVPRDHSAHPANTDAPPERAVRVAVTMVVPCFNEEEGLHYLAETLAGLTHALGDRVDLSFILVDDGSTDATWARMHEVFAGVPRVSFIRHPENRGIAAASITGILASKDEVVAVIDSDCSYDPALIGTMLPHLTPDVSLVTASPYHHDGAVRGVPRWRIFLSRGASFGYSLLLRNKLATYTSCFRLYRRSAVAELTLRHRGFTGVAEKLVQLDRIGWRIVEVPAVLNARKFGQSKLRLMRVIRGHLGLLGSIAFARATNQWKPGRPVAAAASLDKGSSVQ